MHTTKRLLLLGVGALLLANSMLAAAEDSGQGLSKKHQAVTAMQPVGYWPADDGVSDVLHDLSPTGNHGKINHVPWNGEKRLLHFTGAYQWLEIPKHNAYQTPAFSMGGWVFFRSDVIGSGWVNRQGMLLIGNRHWLNGVGVQLCIRKQETIDVVSDGTEDVMGTRLFASSKNDVRVERAYGSPNLAIGKWHHVLYTFEPEKQLSGTPASPNLAPSATVTASNNDGHHSRAPRNAIDGNPETHWIFTPGAGPEADTQKWIQLDLPQETAINRIRLVNRTGSTDNLRAGKLHFSDGSSIEIPNLAEEWDALFADKMVKWVRFEATESHGTGPGLTAFEVYKEDFTVYQEEGVITNPLRGETITGTGRLYLHGQVIAEKKGISYKPAAANLQIGNDAYWWHQMVSKSGSVDGAVRDMVWFDRALSGEEVAHLHEATKPSVTPVLYDNTVIVLDGRAITVNDLASLPPTTRRTALLLFGRKDLATLQPLVDSFLPILIAALDEPNCQLQAIQLLLKLDHEATHAALRNALPTLIAAVQDQGKSQQERADAALALAAMGKAAADAVPALAETLDKLVTNDGIQPPRVEELLRNALTRALLDIAPNHERAQHVIDRTFAGPLMKTVDLTNSALAKATSASDLRALIEAGKHLEAMDIYRKLHRDEREYFFSYRAPHQLGDYTATAHFNGATYKVGTGIAWQGVEKVTAEDFKAVVAEQARQYPAAKAWRQPDDEHLYRVPITKIGADGEAHTVYLEGHNFILDGTDAKCRGWSIFVDELGYIHLMGGQHNAPNPDHYIPGSWEAMGVSRDRKNDDYPLQMYWVSSEPESIDSFKFAGQRSNSQAIPASYLNYMVILQSLRNETFMYGRADAFGWQCWGMFRYDASTKRWTPVGGDPYDLIESARRHDATWLKYLHDPVRGSVPKEPSDIRRLVWAWQPPFYNFCRDDWGARFDKTGRMHVRMTISGLDGAGYVRPTSVYAWSDDRGETFHRADGTEIKLPLTVNPAPEHNAEIDRDNTLQHHHGNQFATRQWWELWLGLLHDAGYRI